MGSHRWVLASAFRRKAVQSFTRKSLDVGGCKFRLLKFLCPYVSLSDILGIEWGVSKGYDETFELSMIDSGKRPEEFAR